MSCSSRLSLACLLLVCLPPRASLAQEPACKPVYEATMKAYQQPGVERTVTTGGTTLMARKTAEGWFSKIDDMPWRKMPIAPEVAERKLLDSPSLYTKCVPGTIAQIAGEAARKWTYVTTAGPTTWPTTAWISVATGLPIRIEGDSTVQVSVYRQTPFPKP
jgi:hypothetical protein